MQRTPLIAILLTLSAGCSTPSAGSMADAGPDAAFVVEEPTHVTTPGEDLREIITLEGGDFGALSIVHRTYEGLITRMVPTPSEWADWGGAPRMFSTDGRGRMQVTSGGAVFSYDPRTGELVETRGSVEGWASPWGDVLASPLCGGGTAESPWSMRLDSIDGSVRYGSPFAIPDCAAYVFGSGGYEYDSPFVSVGPGGTVMIDVPQIDAPTNVYRVEAETSRVVGVHHRSAVFEHGAFAPDRSGAMYFAPDSEAWNDTIVRAELDGEVTEIVPESVLQPFDPRIPVSVERGIGMRCVYLHDVGPEGHLVLAGEPGGWCVLAPDGSFLFASAAQPFFSDPTQWY